MRLFLTTFCCFFILSMQGQKVYKYYVYVNDISQIPSFSKQGQFAVYSGTNVKESQFFAKYQILTFEKSFPTAKWEHFLKIVTIETYNRNLVADLFKNFPTIYTKFEDRSEDDVQLTSYPNDYGITSPMPNTGANVTRDDLDYINTPKAWDISTGNGTKIGISDARIKADDTDFVGKISFVGTTYQHLSYDSGIKETYHGTATAGIAAAQGNNSYGSTGICYDCEIVATGYGGGGNIGYDNLLRLAENGVRVINMSWAVTGNSPAHKMVIDSLVSHYKVILVASAGNVTSYQTPQDKHCQTPFFEGLQRRYPASYDGVISVSGVAHTYPLVLPLNTSMPNYLDISPHPFNIPIYGNFQGSFGGSVDGTDPYNPVGIFYNGYPEVCNPGKPSQYVSSPKGLVPRLTSNPEVDLLAPFYGFHFDRFAEQGVIFYEGGETSAAAPKVSGTAALMLNVDECLMPAEVDNILKLTSKDVESISFNHIYEGQIGAGALDVGDAVEFVNESKKSIGNSVIKNHIFKRFDFKLNRINNKLTIDNVTFKDLCKVDFEARNQIHLKPGTHLKPSYVSMTEQGTIHLKTNPSLTRACSLPVTSAKTGENVNGTYSTVSKIALYPNPNSGSFNIDLTAVTELQNKDVSIEMFDINGRVVYEETVLVDLNNNYTISINDLNVVNGIYFIKVYAHDYSQTLKFIKK